MNNDRRRNMLAFIAIKHPEYLPIASEVVQFSLECWNIVRNTMPSDAYQIEQMCKDKLTDPEALFMLRFFEVVHEVRFLTGAFREQMITSMILIERELRNEPGKRNLLIVYLKTVLTLLPNRKGDIFHDSYY